MKIHNNKYALKVTYLYDETQIPGLIALAKAEGESFQYCQKCGWPFVTNPFYKRTDLCTVCAGHNHDNKPGAKEYHRNYGREYMRRRKKDENNNSFKWVSI